MFDFNNVVNSEEELRNLVGYPSELVNHKVIHHLDSHCSDFISLSPLVFISSSDDQGFCDVSPRGDAPGFVYILDDKRIVIPERPGNRRMDTLRNIIKNPKVGLIFLIPGLEETLRINGQAQIIKDSELLLHMQVNGKVPLLGIGILIEECYVHCAKAFKRSSVWDANSWVNKDKLPNVARMISAHAKQIGLSEEEVSKALHESYTKRLY
ncbi:pyridoxamine 5'-phosphate oxidase family protein [Cohnella sp. AR92]|uniref:pyridoxamine 5'-phosphate oxidase family protein n=1 Tax=Cohnella sp. AR92 TaxID=648716 RepID=UPI000F8C6E1C|nr:pyridoxamine 5'-phosphate oxidase family protein [Cohnella sp. AR92]RUS47934.1 pyridoxamine 5'-phosphate oxidase family protein [Cohnella sp. AR92]